MTTNRTPLTRGRRTPPITPEMVATYRLAVEIANDGDSMERWENDKPPGRRRAYLDTTSKLHALLGRQPWQTEIVDTCDQDAPSSWVRANQMDDWHEARATRVQLEETTAA